jgi:hypothetical protein
MIVMIKIERKLNCQSFFRKENLYDTERITEFRVILFGVTIFKKDNRFTNNFKDEDKNVGFKK